ncbi:DinB family protein [Daejeonella sp.]|uniref:DinB family protein n=1 Tax=Daejeonella sp. TaxID=2805397 RepID=UPI0030C13E22
MKSLISILSICGIILMSSSLFGQGMTDEVIKGHLIADWERAKAYTKEYLDAMPEDGMGFKPTPEVRSFAEQMLHMSQGTIGLIVSGTGATPIFQGKSLEKMDELKTKYALTQVVMQAYDFAIVSIKTLDASKLSNVVKRGKYEVTQYGWLTKAFEHQTHHRAQATIYLRLKGIKPPNEKLF